MKSWHWSFQQDPAPSHRAKTTQEWLKTYVHLKERMASIIHRPKSSWLQHLGYLRQGFCYTPPQFGDSENKTLEGMRQNPLKCYLCLMQDIDQVSSASYWHRRRAYWIDCVSNNFRDIYIYFLFLLCQIFTNCCV